MDDEYPRKVLIKTLSGSSFSCVWVNGKIEQSVGTDLMIISDDSGKAKIIDCNAANRASDPSWFRIGSYCSVIGKLTKNRGLPEIKAIKIRNMTDDEISKEMWETEVQCLDGFMDGKIQPEI